MKIYILALLLVAIIIISGCAAPKNNTDNQKSNASAVLAEVCAGGGEKVKKYLLDAGADLNRTDSMFFLISKCNVFGNCKAESNGTLFTLYAKNLNEENEKTLFNKIDFKSSISLQTETEGNKTTLTVINKTYPVLRFDNERAVEIEGKKIGLGGEVKLDSYALKLHEYRDGEEPVFQVQVIESQDILDVIVPSEYTQVYKIPPGQGRFSIYVMISRESAKRISDLTSNVRVVLGAVTGEANLRSKIYYYADGKLLAIVALPANIKNVASEPYIIIQSSGDAYLETVKDFNWLVTGLKAQTYPEIKLLTTEEIDCRDVVV